MSGIKRYSKIRTTAFLVCLIDTRIYTRMMSADSRNKVAASREPKHPDLVRINFPVGRIMANKAQRSLCILQRGVCLWNDTHVANCIPVRT